MAMVSLENSLSPQETLQEFSNKLTSMLPLVSVSYQLSFLLEYFNLSIRHAQIRIEICGNSNFIYSERHFLAFNNIIYHLRTPRWPSIIIFDRNQQELCFSIKKGE